MLCKNLRVFENSASWSLLSKSPVEVLSLLNKIMFSLKILSFSYFLTRMFPPAAILYADYVTDYALLRLWFDFKALRSTGGGPPRYYLGASFGL